MKLNKIKLLALVVFALCDALVLNYLLNKLGVRPLLLTKDKR